MKEPYFILVLAHSFHGRLRRLHIPQQAIYVLLATVVLGGFAVMGMVSSYARMAVKVANYNSLQDRLETLQAMNARLQKNADETNQQLATLQLFATEISVAYGVKRELEGPPDISAEAPLLPTMHETLEEYNFLKSASLSGGFRKYPRLWQSNVRPSIWPLYGRLLSSFGRRTDPFTGEGGHFHTGVDLSADVGSPVKVTADGLVVSAEYSGNYGWRIIVDHGGIQTWYAHLSRMEVIAGQEVRRGQIIAKTGASGRVTAPHLHYEVRQSGNPINPYLFLARSLNGDAPARDLPF